jgi:ankyrin repeat protein
VTLIACVADVLTDLLQAGADPAETTRAGNFALRAACLLGDMECVIRILDAGADVMQETCRGNALTAAAARVGRKLFPDSALCLRFLLAVHCC